MVTRFSLYSSVRVLIVAPMWELELVAACNMESMFNNVRNYDGRF